VRKWITFHGLAINVNTDLELFSLIKPCGLDAEMTSMSEIKKETVSMVKVKESVVDCFSGNFQLDRLEG